MLSAENDYICCRHKMNIYALLEPALFKENDFPRYVDQRIVLNVQLQIQK